DGAAFCRSYGGALAVDRVNVESGGLLEVLSCSVGCVLFCSIYMCVFVKFAVAEVLCGGVVSDYFHYFCFACNF
ncbi:hypothetical protein L9G16_23200, partial [Shewanella sp. A25]|nr:hypothetical protein [Shewanella shenzhenensis]